MIKRTVFWAAIAMTTSASGVAAGGFGDSAVKDDRVTNSASSGETVYCRRLDQDVPERLAAEMDCSGAARPARRGGLLAFIDRLTGGSEDEGFAEPRVLSEGIGGDGNSSGGSSGSGASGGGSTGGGSSDGGSNQDGDGTSGGGSTGGSSDDSGSNQDDGGSEGGTSGGGSGGGTSGGGTSGGGSTDDGTSGDGTGSGSSDFTSKQDRLSELGAGGDSYKQSSRDFKDEVREFADENGRRGDWSDFNPSSEP